MRGDYLTLQSLGDACDFLWQKIGGLQLRSERNL